MADIINLRIVRKRVARAEREEQAAENRVRFGKTKAERKKSAAEKALDNAKLDGHQRDT